MADRVDQYDLQQGCLEQKVPAEHEARRVRAAVGRLDISATERKYSSLGTRGYPPRNSLAVWVYASQLGIHSSTALAARMQTDAALQWLGGGHEMSEGHLRRFRRANLELFQEALKQTVRLAQEDGLLNLKELAVDSLRLRAEASSSQVRTRKRSKQRLAELEAVEVTTLTAEARATHEAKVAKHREALRQCEVQGTANVVLTNPSAGLMKFPSGASAPGHRVTATVAGVRQRFVVDVFVDAASNDASHLRTALMRLRAGLQDVGVPLQGVSVTADAGYLTHDDLRAADEVRDWADVLIDVPERSRRKGDHGQKLFNLDDFSLNTDGGITCPAGTRMEGPGSDGPHQSRWTGRGCATCPLKPQCTTADIRTLTLLDDYVVRRQAMKTKRASPAGKARYAKRIATVEPVFSYLEDVLHYRRVSSRLESAAVAEILLKVLTYNLLRLRKAKRVSCVRLLIEVRDAQTLYFELFTD